MRRWTLLRHAEAVPVLGDRPRVDEERWLSAHGRQQARSVGAHLRGDDARPDLILASPLTRTIQTAELVAQAAGYTGSIEIEPALRPGSRLSSLIDALTAIDSDRHVLLVGHQPHIGEWSADLLGLHDELDFSPATGVTISFEQAPEPGRASWLFLIAPEFRRAL